MKGMITGLTLDDSVNDLARKFNIALEVCPLFLIYSLDSHDEHPQYQMNQEVNTNVEADWILVPDGGAKKYDTDIRLSLFKLDISLMR
jgi:hypothetical protein